MGCRHSRENGCGKRRVVTQYFDDADDNFCCAPRPACASLCHIDGRSSQRCTENDTFNRCRERSRSQKCCRRSSTDRTCCRRASVDRNCCRRASVDRTCSRRASVDRSCCRRPSNDRSCCRRPSSCCLPAPVASCFSRRCCYPTVNDTCSPNPVCQMVACNTRTQQRCFNCPRSACSRRTPQCGARCEPLRPGPSCCEAVKNCDDYYSCHPLGARCENVRSCEAVNTCDDYYACRPRECRKSGCNKPTGCNRGNKRMNVAIHTHVDYDCERDKCTTRKGTCRKSPCRKPCCPPNHPYGPKCRASNRRQSCDSSESNLMDCGSDDSNYCG